MHSIAGRGLFLTGALACLALSSLGAAQVPDQQQQPPDTVPILKAPEAFHEQLIVKPMNDGSVYTHFQFTTHIGTMQDDDHFAGAASNICKGIAPVPRRSVYMVFAG